MDTQSNAAIPALPNFATDGFVATDDGGGGATCPARGPDGSANGACLVNLAGYMFNHDMRGNVTGKQVVTTYVVGFGDDIAESADYLEDVATAGGGKSYTQNDAAGLTAALEEIFADVKENANSTFVSPTVAVNAFNRTRNLNTLFVSVFAPTKRAHWPGNVKKYQLINGVIHGTDTATPAVDENTGFFAGGTSDLFEGGGADGADVTQGGAAVNLPAWDARKIYTYLGTSDDLTADVNRFSVANTTNITAEMVGVTPVDATRMPPGAPRSSNSRLAATSTTTTTTTTSMKRASPWVIPCTRVRPWPSIAVRRKSRWARCTRPPTTACCRRSTWTPASSCGHSFRAN